MNKFTIPTILTATIMVAGMFAFMPVEQASTVHATISGSGDIDNTELNTALTTIDDFLDTEIGSPIGSLSAEAEATQEQLALLVTSNGVSDPSDGVVSTDTELLSAANNKAGIAYVTLLVQDDGGGANGGITVDVLDGNVIGTIAIAQDGADVTQTFAFATDGTNAIQIDESTGGDQAGETWRATIVVIATSADTTS